MRARALRGERWRALIALGLALTASACASKVDEAELRAVWVPREESHGLVVADEASRVPAPHVRPGEAPRDARTQPLLKRDE